MRRKPSPLSLGMTSLYVLGIDQSINQPLIRLSVCPPVRALEMIRASYCQLLDLGTITDNHHQFCRLVSLSFPSTIRTRARLLHLRHHRLLPLAALLPEARMCHPAHVAVLPHPTDRDPAAHLAVPTLHLVARPLELGVLVAPSAR